MATLIEKIQKQLDEKNFAIGGRNAKNWLLTRIKTLNAKGSDRLKIISEGTQKNRTIIGRFYLFFYDAKLKDELPYWDKFPMVIPIQRYSDGFLGLNLHYITPRDRLILLKQLERFQTGSLGDEKTRLKLSYPILKATANAYRATPCIKRYLVGHIRSRVVEIPATEWQIAAALPLQQFKSNTQSVNDQMVFEDSKEKM